MVTIQTSMTCGSCLKKIQPGLDAQPSIESWEADLEDPQKTVRVQLKADAPIEPVLAIIQEAGFQANVLDQKSDQLPASSPPKFDLLTYKPLFLVVSYVLGATVLFQAANSQWSWQGAMSSFMGFFFLGFAFFKLLDVSKFADAFATYDVVAKRFRLYAMSYPWLELGLGILFVTQTGLIFSNVLTALVMGVGLIGVIAAVRKKQTIQCACLGTAFNLPMSSVTIIENSVMLLMAIAMLVWHAT